jgi:hypothetical protein
MYSHELEYQRGLEWRNRALLQSLLLNHNVGYPMRAGGN